MKKEYNIPMSIVEKVQSYSLLSPTSDVLNVNDNNKPNPTNSTNAW